MAVRPLGRLTVGVCLAAAGVLLQGCTLYSSSTRWQMKIENGKEFDFVADGDKETSKVARKSLADPLVIHVDAKQVVNDRVRYQATFTASLLNEQWTLTPTGPSDGVVVEANKQRLSILTLDGDSVDSRRIIEVYGPEMYNTPGKVEIKGGLFLPDVHLSK